MRKQVIVALIFSALLPVAQASASNVGFNIGVNVGTPVAPVYAAQPVVIAEPPQFVAPPELGFYVAVGVPYDLFFYGNQYWLNRGGVWYSAPYYNGPWVVAGPKNIPYGIRKHSIGKIHYSRDNYYKRYHGAPGFHNFRPERHDMGRGHGGERGPERGHGGERGQGHGR